MTSEEPKPILIRICETLTIILSVGGFVLILLVAVLKNPDRDGLIGGLLFGSFFGLLSYWGMRRANRQAAIALEQLQGRRPLPVNNHKIFVAWLVSSLIAAASLLLAVSCRFYSCQTDVIRPRLIFLLLATAVVVSNVLSAHWFAGRKAWAADAVIVMVFLFFLGKIFLVW